MATPAYCVLRPYLQNSEGSLGAHSSHAPTHPAQPGWEHIHGAMPLLLLVVVAACTCSVKATRNLHKAAQQDDLDDLKAAINGQFDASSKNINGFSRKGETALTLAICNDFVAKEAVKVLLEGGADPDARNRFGNAALHLIARSTCGEEKKDANRDAGKIVRLLLKHGADVNVKTTGPGWSRDGSFGLTPLHVAADAGNLRMLELLLANGAAIDAVDSGGNTALHHAARGLRAKAVWTLLREGADASSESGDGKLPMDIVRHGKDSFAKTIREHLGRARNIRAEAVREKKAAAKKMKKVSEGDSTPTLQQKGKLEL